MSSSRSPKNIRVLLRLPGESVVAFAANELNPVIGSTVPASPEAFVYAPFRPDAAPNWVLKAPAPVAAVRSDIEEWDTTLPAHTWHTTTYDEYQRLAKRALEALRSGDLQKVVLSKVKTVPRPRGFSVLSCFDALCGKYPNAAVHLLAIEGETIWLGASPEQLISFSENRLQTVSLAGTQTLQGRAPESLQWGDKEREEQEMVTQHIARIMAASPAIGRIEQTGPESVPAGQIAHLRTTFTAQTEPGFDWSALLAVLHPTPAIAGYPKDKALQYIEQCEAHRRLYYGGYLGIADATHAQLYLNLRCMRLDGQHIQLFSGGGYTAASEVAAEWQETEYKASTLLSVIENLQNFESS